MSNERLQYRMETGYAEALGLAAYMFARLEWNVVWCCERLEEGSVSELQELTAGVVRRRFGKLVLAIADDELRDELVKAADVFNPLVDLRNDLIHGTPCTHPSYGQCLNGNTGAWSIDRINQAADAFAECAIIFNGILYGSLKKPS
ncbi:MAG: hypothetical protein KKC24_23785 [Gammaproteobacteria bacterium]|nr:hypothetical protein [Gammaproteobacteria bacterium]MBU0821870.1 hypothetical protein [Gammaproteobacteria bacterium]MBU0843983.1 hypothetical protein [Gammaproteobacteria bacterium]MBU1842234.1 hypothetical protein [Gammaproteobacteria bacterium]